MLHLRLIVPVDLRDTVLGQLDRDFGVTHVIVLPGAANAAVALGHGDFAQFRGSTVQSVLNMAGIVVAGVLTLLVQQAAWRLIRRRAATAGPGNG